MPLSVADYRAFAEQVMAGTAAKRAEIGDAMTVFSTLQGIATIQERVTAAGGGTISTIDQLITRIRQAYPAEAAAYDAWKLSNP